MFDDDDDDDDADDDGKLAVADDCIDVLKLGLCNDIAFEMGDRVGFNSRCRTSISVCNQPATQGQLSLPSLRGR